MNIVLLSVHLVVFMLLGCSRESQVIPNERIVSGKWKAVRLDSELHKPDTDQKLSIIEIERDGTFSWSNVDSFLISHGSYSDRVNLPLLDNVSGTWSVRKERSYFIYFQIDSLEYSRAVHATIQGSQDALQLVIKSRDRDVIQIFEKK